MLDDIEFWISLKVRRSPLLPNSGRCIFVYLCTGLDAAEVGVAEAVMALIRSPVQVITSKPKAGHGIRQVDAGRGLAFGSGGYELVLVGLTGRRWR
jgi:hypothetical protein